MSKIPALLLALILPAAVTLSASDQLPAAPQARPVVIRGATIHPVSGPAIADGMLLFDRGKIIALGREVAVPADAVVVEAAGKHVYPGLIAASSRLGLVEIDYVRQTSDESESGELNPNVRAERAINPDSERIPVTRTNGVALAAVLPEGGLISGMGALVRLDGWTWEEMTMRAPLCLAINWPQAGGHVGLIDPESRKQRRERIAGQIDRLDRAFEQARAYRASRRANGAAKPTRGGLDQRWEALLPVLEGQVPVWIAADYLRDIEAAVEWSARQGLRMVLVGGMEAPRAAALLKAHGVPVLAGPIHRLPLGPDEPFDDPFTLPARLQAAGLEFCIIGSPASGNDRNLPFQAATAAAYGLPPEEALKAVTLYPARIMGIGDRAGSLEPGKDATLLIADGDPLEAATTVEALYIEGREVDLDSRQKQLYRKYQEKYRRLTPVKPETAERP